MAGTSVLEQLDAAWGRVRHRRPEASKLLLPGGAGEEIDHRSLTRLTDCLNSEQRWTRLVCDVTGGHLDLQEVSVGDASRAPEWLAPTQRADGLPVSGRGPCSLSSLATLAVVHRGGGISAVSQWCARLAGRRCGIGRHRWRYRGRLRHRGRGCCAGLPTSGPQAPPPDSAHAR